MCQYTSPEGILVSDKNQSSYIKPFVDDINQQIMFAEKSWGNFREYSGLGVRAVRWLGNRLAII